MPIRSRLTVIGLVVLLTAAMTSLGGSEEEPPGLGTRVFMRVKLTSSQKVLEGLVTRDFALIAKGAEEMTEMSKAAKWPRAEDELYEHLSVEFRRLSGKVADMAQRKNLDGASLAYMQLTATCITCHEHVRGSLKVTREPTGPFRLIPTVPTKP